MAPPAEQKPNQLPPKENTLFKRIVKCYEHKQYKNGLKFAKQILSNPKYSEHGETLAMKGLIMNCMGKKQDAHELVKRGLKNDLKSHVCWHVFGLLARSEKKYDEAIKAYRNALKWDKDNIQILRDLSLLQIQMRDLEGYKETRFQLFALRPTQKTSWICYAMSHHLLQEYDMALRVLEEYRKTQTVKSYDFEHSEFLLYQNLVLRESGRFEEALKHLGEFEGDIGDKLECLELKADLMFKLNRLTDAENLYRQLIKRNPENRTYYNALTNCLRITDESAQLAMFEQLRHDFPKAAMPKRLALNVAKGAKFLDLVSSYLESAFRKGVPPVFVDLRSLYADEDKIFSIEKLVLSYLENLRSSCKFAPNSNQFESPSVIVWVLYFAAQHFDYKNETEKALQLINEALIHTPTLIELYMVQGRIYKHAGAFKLAARCLDEAQSLDTADRYINSKAAKYLLGANKILEAEMMCSKFTREGIPAMDNLIEMQCMWFEIECAKAFKRLKQFGLALKKCHEVEKHFAEIVEDQFDFHTYCIRKMTLCAYFRMLKMEDTLRKHRFYVDAALIAIRIYLRLHDSPQEVEDGSSQNKATVTAAEMKKMKSKQRKAAKKAEQAKADQKVAVEKREQHIKTKQPVAKDEDGAQVEAEPLDPERLLKCENALNEAVKFFMPLLELNCPRIEAFLLGFEIYLRMEKPLMMLQCICRANAIDASNPKLHVCKIKFLNELHENKSKYGDVVNEVIDSVLPKLCPIRDAKMLNSQYREQYKDSLPHLAAVAQCECVISPEASDAAVRFLMTICNNSELKGASWKCHKHILKLLRSGDFGASGENYAESFLELCRKKLPIVDYFAAAEPKVEVVTNDDVDVVAEE